ncbi:sulfate transporter 1.3 isoform X3 [Manihot esculenta]|uniref:sulfate transporter 1.3 isoform X3 n=1 Tax=Manihot esculenta TaxID=3983 RepID=UPI001CC5DC58|nr:sulfate transporter 1.3 isoform X3 [Manihot esculenta]
MNMEPSISAPVHSTDKVHESKDMDTISLSSSHCQAHDTPHIHKVGIPPKQNLLKEIKATVKETFFADDPLRPFKDQTGSKRFILVMQTIFPILEWGRSYNITKFRGDIIAGLTIASLCIPQDIAYAKLANLDPQYGLCKSPTVYFLHCIDLSCSSTCIYTCYCLKCLSDSSFVPPLIYALMGSSRDIAIGPVAVVSLLLGTLLQNEVDSKKEAETYRRLAFTATFFAGITQATLGFFRLGFLIDFLSHAAVVGFMGGAAITIALQQLKGLLGIQVFTKKTDIVSVLHSVFVSAHHGWNWQTIVIGLSFLAFLLFAKYIVKYIEKGINPSSVKEIYFSGQYLPKGFKIGVVAGMIGLTEAIAIGRTFASMKDYQLDGNKEMVALGTMNIVGSMTSCYVATGSFSRSAVNYMAGCQTAVSNIVMSFIVFLTLQFITPLFKYTPNAILAAIIISAVLGLVDFEAAILIWKIDKFDFIACIGAFFGVVFSSVEIGLLIAVAISFAKILLQVTRPRTAILGNLPGTTVYRNIQQYPGATKVQGVLIVRVDSAIYFSNSNYVKERILRWLVDEEEELKASYQPKIQFLIVEMSPVTDIDTSGIHALEELHKSLQKRDVQLILSNPGPVVINKLHESNFANTIGEDKIFLTVADAVASCCPKLATEV